MVVDSDSAPAVVGRVVDLSVRFGRQIRLKCLGCTKFVLAGERICCSCGAVYQRLSGTFYEVV